MTTTNVINYLTDNIAEDFNIPKKKAKEMLLKSLLYNVVIAEIKDQIEFLLDEEAEWWKREVRKMKLEYLVTFECDKGVCVGIAYGSNKHKPLDVFKAELKNIGDYRIIRIDLYK